MSKENKQSGKNKTKIVPLLKFARKNYKDYGLAVLEDRAIPDFRDGMNPVNRKSLWSAHDKGFHSKSKVVKSARLVGECVVGSTLVETTQGKIPIDSLVLGDVVKTPIGDKRVTNIFNNGEKQTFKLTTSEGTIFVTKDHKIFVIRKNKLLKIKVKDLRKDEQIVCL